MKDSPISSIKNVGTKIHHNQRGSAPQSPGGTLSNGSPVREYIHVEDYDEQIDGRFVRDFLTPYLRDVYRDLSLRSLAPAAVKEKKVDKVTFVQYCNVPGIISERLLKLFDVNSDGCITE